MLPQKLSGNLLDTHEQTIVAPKNEENVEYIDEEDNTSNSRRIIFVILAVLVIGCIYAFMKCQGNNEAIDKAAPNMETTIDESVHNQSTEQDEQGYNSFQESQARVYEEVEEMPSFPGGPDALMEWLNNNVKYPVQAQENGVQGRVIVSFVVETDGRIGEAEVARSVDPYLDREALRVVKSMPRWIPGRQNGECVRVRYNVPIAFRLVE